MRIVRGILLLLFLYGASNTAWAIHMKGGWMYYTYDGTTSTGQLKYKIYLKLYRDCATPTSGQNNPTIDIDFFRNSDNARITTISAVLGTITPLEKTTFDPCINPKPTVCYRVLNYEGNVALDPSPQGYTAAFQRCCRVSGIVNVQSPSDNYGGTYTLQFPGNEITDAVKNSSPRFAEKDTVAICFNSAFALDYSAMDPDGDSLVYELTDALNGGSKADPIPAIAAPPPYSSIRYGGSFSAADPFGTNVKIDPTTGFITGTSPSRTGEYVLAVAVKEYRNGKYLAESRKEIHVNIAACGFVSADLPLNTLSCDSYAVTFQNLSSSPAINEYLWDFGVTTSATDTSSKPVPTFTYADTGIYYAKLVVNKSSACPDSSVTAVKVYPGFKTDFNFKGSCYQSPFNFSDASTTKYGFINSWKWDFGDASTSADTSLLKNPVYKYPQKLGQYTVTLTSMSNKGCMGTTSKLVDVSDKPYMKLPFTDTLICSIDSLMLQAEGDGIFSWTPNTRIINSNTPTPIVFPLHTTTYTVSLTEGDCFTSGNIVVNVIDSVNVSLGNDTTICRTDGITLKPVTNGLYFNWTPGTGLSNTTVKNPVATPLTPTANYKVKVTVGKCSNFDDINITTIPYPRSNAGSDTSICFNGIATLRGNADADVIRTQWTPASIVQYPQNLLTEAYPKTTTNFVLYTYENKGCPKPGKDTVVVTVYPRTVVFAGNDTSAVIGQSLQLNAISNATIYQWTPSLNLSSTTIANPVLFFNDPGIIDTAGYFTYRVTVATPAGCEETDDITVRIFKTQPTIFVPNAFTPNQDGKNDAIKPILAGMKQLLYFRVFNRYGKIVFETKQEGRGWDGKVKGEPQDTSAYVYDCRAIDYLGNPVKQSGTFVLIR